MIDLIFAVAICGTIWGWVIWGVLQPLPSSRTWFITAVSGSIFVVVWAIVYGHDGHKWMC